MRNLTQRNSEIKQELRRMGKIVIEDTDGLIHYRDAKPWELEREVDFLYEATMIRSAEKDPVNPVTYKTFLLGAVVAFFVLVLSGCTVPKGELEFEPVVTEEVYNLGPYQEVTP